jgi:hypothetical protein
MIRIVAIIAAALLIPPATAAVVVAQPSTLPAVFKSAVSGDTIVLATGDYGDVQLPRGDYSPALEIDGRAARFRSIIIRSTKGIHLRGGTLIGPPEQTHGVLIDGAQRITVADMVVTGVRVGIATTKSTDVEITGNRLDGVRSDGINLAMVQRVRVVGNQCLNFRPIAAIYDAAGKLVKDGDHADCIQGWSRLAYPPTSDVLIEGNTAEGAMHGVGFFDPGQGGYDRITVRGNVFRLASTWHGVSIYEGRSIVIRDNKLLPVPGSRQAGGNRGLTYPWVSAPGSDAVACGNVVAARASRYGTGRCS